MSLIFKKNLSFFRFYQLGLFLNTFPIIFNLYYSQDTARLFFVPYFYIPGLIILSLIGIASLKIKKSYLLLIFFYMSVTFYTTFINGLFSLGTFVYWISFPVAIILFNCSQRFFNKNNNKINFYLKNYVWTIFICSLIGIIFYHLYNGPLPNNGWTRFNPFATSNLNGSSILIAFSFYLSLSANVFSKPIFEKFKTRLYLSLFFGYCLILSGSRMALIILITIIVFEIFKSIFKNRNSIYTFWSKRNAKIAMISSIILIPQIIINSDSGLRLIRVFNTFTDPNNLCINAGNCGDFKRFLYLEKSYTLFLENPLFGTGSGLLNYQNSALNLFDESFSKAHNFYISYLTENGIIGFSIMLMILCLIFSELRKSKNTTFAFVIAISLFFNEYIFQPELWLITALLTASSNKNSKKIDKTSEDLT